MAGRQINAGSFEDASAQDNMVGKFIHEISAEHSTDKEECWIVGSVLLPRGRLAVVDRNNKCVKLFDLKDRRLTGKMSFSLQPLDITAIGEDRLALVFFNQDYKDENKQIQYKNKEVQFLQLLHVKPKLARSTTLPLPGRSYGGVTCQGEKLYLLCLDPPSIQIFNLNGTLLRQINDEDNKGEELLRLSISIAVSPDGAHIYVCCLFLFVVCLTTEGQAVWIFRPRRILYGMNVDTLGRLFVCSDPPIHVLSSAGCEGTLQLEREDLIPETVAVGDSRMYIGGKYNVISVFRLEAADSARQLQYVCEDLPLSVDQSMNLPGDISLRDSTRERDSYRLQNNNRYDSPSENQPQDLPSLILFRDTNRDRESCRLPGSNRPDVLLEHIEEEPPVKSPKFE